MSTKPEGKALSKAPSASAARIGVRGPVVAIPNEHRAATLCLTNGGQREALFDLLLVGSPRLQQVVGDAWPSLATLDADVCLACQPSHGDAQLSVGQFLEVNFHVVMPVFDMTCRNRDE